MCFFSNHYRVKIDLNCVFKRLVKLIEIWLQWVDELKLQNDFNRTTVWNKWQNELVSFITEKRKKWNIALLCMDGARGSGDNDITPFLEGFWDFVEIGTEAWHTSEANHYSGVWSKLAPELQFASIEPIVIFRRFQVKTAIFRYFDYYSKFWLSC